MMDRNESTRLATLQDDAKQGTTLASETLTFADLLLLLREDNNLRTLIRDIVAMPRAVAASDEHDADRVTDEPNTADHRAGATVFPATESTSPLVDTLREQLRPELMLLQLVRADTDLADDWLGGHTDEGRQLLQVVACAAQWDVLADLWDKLASRCKQAQRAANADELYILQTSLALHNLRWRGRQARLVEVSVGTAYDYERHQRGTTTGDYVCAQWLPGLVNAGGQLQKKPLVQT